MSLRLEQHGLDAARSLIVPEGWMTGIIVSAASQAPESYNVTDPVTGFIVRRSVMYERDSVFDMPEFQGALSGEDRAQIVANPGVTVLDKEDGSKILNDNIGVPTQAILNAVRGTCQKLPPIIYGHTTRVDVFGPERGMPGQRFVALCVDRAGQRRITHDHHTFLNGSRAAKARGTRSHLSFLRTEDPDVADELALFYNEIIGNRDAPMAISQAHVIANTR